ncbi:MAG: EamA family transporter [bacterium]
MRSANSKAILAWLSISIIWGTTYLAIRIGVADLPPLLFAGIRWITASSILIIYFLIRKEKFPSPKELVHLGIIGISLLGIANALVVVAEIWVPSGVTALIITTLPFWMVGLESLIPSGPKLNWRIVLGLMIGICGVLIIFGNNFAQLLNTDYLVGVLALIGGVTAWSAGSLYSKYKKINVRPLMGATMQMLIAGLAQATLGLILGEAGDFHLHGNSLLALLYLIIAGSLIGYTSYIYALEHLPAAFVSTYAYINPVIALFLGWLILDEEINWYIGIAAVIILIGVAFVKSGSRIPIKDKSI